MRLAQPLHQHIPLELNTYTTGSAKGQLPTWAGQEEYRTGRTWSTSPTLSPDSKPYPRPLVLRAG